MGPSILCYCFADGKELSGACFQFLPLNIPLTLTALICLYCFCRSQTERSSISTTSSHTPTEMPVRGAPPPKAKFARLPPLAASASVESPPVRGPPPPRVNAAPRASPRNGVRKHHKHTMSMSGMALLQLQQQQQQQNPPLSPARQMPARSPPRTKIRPVPTRPPTRQGMIKNTSRIPARPKQSYTDTSALVNGAPPPPQAPPPRLSRADLLASASFSDFAKRGPPRHPPPSTSSTMTVSSSLSPQTSPKAGPVYAHDHAPRGSQIPTHAQTHAPTHMRSQSMQVTHQGPAYADDRGSPPLPAGPDADGFKVPVARRGVPGGPPRATRNGGRGPPPPGARRGPPPAGTRVSFSCINVFRTHYEGYPKRRERFCVLSLSLVVQDLVCLQPPRMDMLRNNHSKLISRLSACIRSEHG